MAEVTCGSQENATALPVRLNASRSAEYFANEFRLTSPQLNRQGMSGQWNEISIIIYMAAGGGDGGDGGGSAAAHLSTLMKSTPNSRASDLASCDS